MSFDAWRYAMSSPAKGVQQHVLVGLADFHIQNTGICDPSIAEVAELTGLGATTVRRAIRQLEAAGLLIVHGTEGGRQQHARYVFPSPKVAPDTRPLRPSKGQPKLSRSGAHTRPLRPSNEGETRPERSEYSTAPADVVLRTKTREPGREADADAPPAAQGDALFDEPVTPASRDRKRVKVAQAIANRYCELEPLSKYVSVLGIVKRPLESDRFSGEMVMAAVEQLAREQRPLTLETLRVQLVGLPPRANGSNRNNRSPLRERLKGGAA